MVEIFDNRIDVSSPGGLVPGLTEKEFGTKSVLRNPNISEQDAGTGKRIWA